MKIIARKPKVRVTFDTGRVRFGEVNHTTIEGWYDVTLDDELGSILVPSTRIEYLADLDIAPMVRKVAA